MNLIELQRALRQLRLGGMAAVLETRLRQAQSRKYGADRSDLVSGQRRVDRRSERLLDRRRKQAAFRDRTRPWTNFDFTFNPKMNRSLVFDLATCAFIGKREDALFLGPGGTGKSHLAQAIGQAAIQQNYRVMYRETHVLLDHLAEAVAEGTRKTVHGVGGDACRCSSSTTSACASCRIPRPRICWKSSCAATSGPARCSPRTVPVEDWGKLLGDVAAVTAMLDRILHHGHVLKCGPKSWRTKL
jgi:DNA replication protein DnaC